MRIVLTVICILIAAISRADKIDDIVQKHMTTQKIPGVALMVIRNGKAIKMKGYGLANVEHKVPVKPETIFQIGSIGKQFTSMLVMMSVQDGQLKLEDSISKYFPEAGGLWEGIQVRHLLSHTSGLARMRYSKMDLRKDYTEAELVRFMSDAAPIANPGEEWSYNNGGYVLLGILVKRLTGKFYGDLLHDRVFKPLGMKSARIISESAIVPNRAAGYVLEAGGIRNQSWVSPQLNTTADGSLYLSLPDFQKWDAALNGTRLLKANYRDKLWTPFKLNNGKSSAGTNGTGYGFGWDIEMVGKHVAHGHGGASQGFSTWYGRVPQQKISIVVLTNLDGDHSNPAVIGVEIFNSLIGN